MLKEIFKNKNSKKINFVFFGGSDLSNNIYNSNGYRNFINLFEDYIRHKGPYIFDNKDNKEIYGRRYIFDLSINNYSLKDIVDNFDILLSNLETLIFVLTIDSKDILEINNDQERFEIYLSKFLNKCLIYNDKCFIIIRNHFNINDSKFNENNRKINKCINKILNNYLEYKNKQIILIDHCNLSNNENFFNNCLTNNELNNYGQLELTNQFINSIFFNAIPINEVTTSIDDIKNKNIINHNIFLNNFFFIKKLP